MIGGLGRRQRLILASIGDKCIVWQIWISVNDSPLFCHFAQNLGQILYTKI